MFRVLPRCVMGVAAVIAVHVLTGCAAPARAFAPVADLPVVEGLPDPFLMEDGRRVRTLADWREQRAYLRDVLLHYFYGSVPPKPTRFCFVRTASGDYKGLGIEERYHLVLYRHGKRAVVRVALVRPREAKRYPTIIRNHKFVDFVNRGGSDDAFAADEALRRGYLFCKFDRNDVWPDAKGATGGVRDLYPEYSWGAIASWAWTYQVVIDALDGLGCVDTERIVATGHSRGGQATVAAGIIDERIDVLVPSTGGFWSVGTVRQRDPGGARGTVDVVDLLADRHPHWYTERYYEFAGRQDRLPWDGHTLAALIAPRPLLNTNAADDPVNNTLATEAGIRAAKIVYEWMGAGGMIRLHMRSSGGHAQSEADYRALFDFTDEVFFGKRGATEYNRWLHPDVPLRMDWAAPG